MKGQMRVLPSSLPRQAHGCFPMFLFLLTFCLPPLHKIIFGGRLPTLNKTQTKQKIRSKIYYGYAFSIKTFDKFSLRRHYPYQVKGFGSQASVVFITHRAVCRLSHKHPCDCSGILYHCRQVLSSGGEFFLGFKANYHEKFATKTYFFSKNY